jgi:hypothetical protein
LRRRNALDAAEIRDALIAAFDEVTGCLVSALLVVRDDRVYLHALYASVHAYDRHSPLDEPPHGVVALTHRRYDHPVHVLSLEGAQACALFLGVLIAVL